MASKTFFIAFCVGMGLALGDVPEQSMPPGAKPKVIDLDFTGDDETWTAASNGAERRKTPGPWIYWTIGAGVAAAGGVGWYLFQDRQEATVTRNEQVFTDER
jgi:hypothetical protein